ncbi:MAG: hypothetical protein RL213_44 [Bacteroidota bacterium]
MPGQTDEFAMQLNRRKFLRSMAGSSVLLASGLWSDHLFAAGEGTRIVLLHTNDVHSRIDPFPANDPKFPGMGGFARRSEVIRRIRSEHEHVLLLDAGDIFQGTPYFNLFQGEPEIRLMNQMGYDAATIGNHDFDGGIDNLATRMRQADFPFLSVNYDLEDTPLVGLARRYKVFRKGRVRVGVFGIGIDPAGLIDPSVCKGVAYLDPLKQAEMTSRLLRDEERCDLVICLSHLGYQYAERKVSDEILAKETSGIDIIIGGHTHTFLDTPVKFSNREGRQVLVAQAGWGGVRLGRVDFMFTATYGKSVHFTSQENLF